MTPPASEPTQTQPRDSQDRTAKSYPGAGEEWSASTPEESALGEHVSPSASRAAGVPPAPGVAVDGRHGPGHVRGIARSVQVRTGEHLSVLSFRVDQYDAAGNRVQPVGVELSMYLSGQVSEGEEVDVAGKWKNGTLQADRIINLTTGAEIKGPSRAYNFIGATFLIVIFVFFFGVLAFMAILAFLAITNNLPH